MILKRMRSLVEVAGNKATPQDTSDSFKKPFQLALGAMAKLQTLHKLAKSMRYEAAGKGIRPRSASESAAGRVLPANCVVGVKWCKDKGILVRQDISAHQAHSPVNQGMSCQ
jgi:hypothetical protein